MARDHEALGNQGITVSNVVLRVSHLHSVVDCEASIRIHKFRRNV